MRHLIRAIDAAVPFDPKEHPHAPAGTKKGGQFVKKGTGGSGGAKSAPASKASADPQKAGPGYIAATKKITNIQKAFTGPHMMAAPLDRAKWPKFLKDAGFYVTPFFRTYEELKKQHPEGPSKKDPTKDWPKEGKGWAAIQIAKDPKANYWAAGVAPTGKWQPLRSPHFAASKAEKKFGRVWDCKVQRPKLIAYNEAYAKNPQALAKKLSTDERPISPDQAKSITSIHRLMELMGLRVDSQTETNAKTQAYGASTLEGRHVKMERDGLHLDFDAKDGVHINLLVTDPTIKKDLLERKEKTGRGGTGRLFPDIKYSDVLNYTKTFGDGKFINHDFRAAFATVEAEKRVAKMAAPKNPKEYRAATMAIAGEVSKLLGNKPDQALNAYIEPRVFAKWRGSAGVV